MLLNCSEAFYEVKKNTLKGYAVPLGLHDRERGALQFRTWQAAILSHN